MEQAPGPTPNIFDKEDKEKKGFNENEIIEEKEILEEHKFSIIKNKMNYILICSKTNNDSIILNLKLDEEIVYFYYEIECHYKKLTNLSRIFDLSENSSESYEVLIENLNKYKEDIILDFNGKILIISIKFLFPSGKTKYGKITLDKKENDLNIILQKLNSKFISMHEKQETIENKFDEKINLIISEQNILKEKLDKNLDNIKTIKLSNSKLEQIINQNKEAINKIREEQNNNKNIFLKYENESEENKVKQLNNEIEIKELNNYVNKSFEKINLSIEKKINLIGKNQDKLDTIINKNNKEIIQIDKQLSTYNDSFEKINKDINLLKDNQRKMKNNYEEEILKINSIELNQTKLKESREDKEKELKDSLNKALNEIEFLKNKINENEKNIKLFKEKINILEEQKNKKEENKIEIKEPSKNEKKIIQQYQNNKEKVKSIKKVIGMGKFNTRNYNDFKKFSTEPNNNERKEEKIKVEKKEENSNPFFKKIERYSTQSNFFKRPHNFTLSGIISTKLFTKYCNNNSACIFNQKYKIYIAYGVNSLDLECYDYLLDDNFLLFKKLHKEPFDSCRYFYDNKNYKDLIITSSHDSHVKVIDFKEKDSTLILDLDFEYIKDVIINTAYFIDNKIMIPFAFHTKSGRVSFYNLKGIKINELKSDPGFVLCLNGYYHEDKQINYAIVSNSNGIYVYNINNYSLYNKFIPKIKSLKSTSFSEGHIIEIEEKIVLVGPLFSEGFLYLWNLISKDLFKLIKLSYGLTDICFWSNNYIFATYNGSIKDKFVLININDKEVEKGFGYEEIEKTCYGIKILRNRIEGEFLITYTSEGKLYLYKI